MDLSIEDLKSIHDMISEPERECMKLREKLRQTEEELQRKTSECEQLREELCCARSIARMDVNLCVKEGYIVISLKRLKKFLSGLKNMQLMGFIVFLVQKLLPKEADASTLQLIADTAPEEMRPDIINVAGDYNNFQNNNNINLQNQ